MSTEADTCRTYVVPKLHAAGWDDEQIREQVTFTDGRIVPIATQGVACFPPAPSRW
jgi:type I restriction enzyme R subunit